MKHKKNCKDILAGISFIKGFVSLYSTGFIFIKYIATKDFSKTDNFIHFIKTIDNTLTRAAILFGFLVAFEYILKGLIKLQQSTDEEINSYR